jgi:Flp pilus assembly protein TadD
MAQAVPLLRELLIEKKDDEWCVLTLARCLIGLGQLKEARALLDTTSPEAQHSAHVQLMLADLSLAEGNKAQAISHVETAKANGVPHHLVFNQIGRAFLQFGRWQEAADVFGKSLETEPDNPAALDGLASVHLAEGEWESAVEKSLEAVGLAHFYPDAHFHLAVGLERSGRTREAIAAYETALGFGYQPALLHRHLVELFKPIDAHKAGEHERAFIRLIRQPLYRADFKSSLVEESVRTPEP